jgi:hypothetical protein
VTLRLDELQLDEAVGRVAYPSSEVLRMKPAHTALDPPMELSRAGRIFVYTRDDVLITRLKRLQAAGADVDDADLVNFERHAFGSTRRSNPLLLSQ